MNQLVKLSIVLASLALASGCKSKDAEATISITPSGVSLESPAAPSGVAVEVQKPSTPVAPAQKPRAKPSAVTVKSGEKSIETSGVDNSMTAKNAENSATVKNKDGKLEVSGTNPSKTGSVTIGPNGAINVQKK